MNTLHSWKFSVLAKCISMKFFLLEHVRLLMTADSFNKTYYWRQWENVPQIISVWHQIIWSCVRVVHVVWCIQKESHYFMGIVTVLKHQIRLVVPLLIAKCIVWHFKIESRMSKHALWTQIYNANPCIRFP